MGIQVSVSIQRLYTIYAPYPDRSIPGMPISLGQLLNTHYSTRRNRSQCFEPAKHTEVDLVNRGTIAGDLVTDALAGPRAQTRILFTTRPHRSKRSTILVSEDRIQWM